MNRQNTPDAASGFLSKMALALLPALCLLIASHANGHAASALAWQTKLNADHPLVGRIFDVKAGKEINPDKLVEKLSSERYVLLGEIHDNPDHHKLQAYIIDELGKRGRRPAVVMEQIGAGQKVLLNLFMSGKHKTAARLGPAIEWQKQGWPAWPNYQPIAESAFKHDMSIRAGDSARATNRKIGKEGFKALSGAEVKELGLDQPLDKALDDDLLEQLVVSHCNMMPKSRMQPMSLVQRYRDAHLARAMRQAGNDGAILVAGNGHVRNDRGVPWYLRGDNSSSLTLMIVEAHEEAKEPYDLIAAAPDGRPVADFVWITPGSERKDPCESLKKRFGGKMPKSHGK